MLKEGCAQEVRFFERNEISGTLAALVCIYLQFS